MTPKDLETAPVWWSPVARARESALRARLEGLGGQGLADALAAAAASHARDHDGRALNLNPATNVMNPAAERYLASGLATRPSLGAPGEKYEMGLEAAEEIETIAGTLARRVFGAAFAETRAPSGAVANLMGFLACCRPGDRAIVPPEAIAGHVTHHTAGAAGLLGLEVHTAPVDAERYSVDLPGLAALAERVRPRLVTLGGSLNLTHHPLAEVVRIAHGVGARVLFDAAHLSGPIAGGVWPNPLAEGADLMTMSTYKSLGGPPGGLVLTNDPELAERVDRIAFPGLTANFDLGRVAALGRALVDWEAPTGPAYAREMVAAARTLAAELYRLGAPVFFAGDVATEGHAFALDAAEHGGGQAMARHLARARLLASGIGLPAAPVAGDANGLRLGLNEAVRRGLTADDMGELAELIVAALAPEPERIAPAVTAFRRRFDDLRFVT
ncbi:MAG: serine hydroxymethyltransferase [Paracoccaceae bacterium]